MSTKIGQIWLRLTEKNTLKKNPQSSLKKNLGSNSECYWLFHSKLSFPFFLSHVPQGRSCFSVHKSGHCCKGIGEKIQKPWSLISVVLNITDNFQVSLLKQHFTHHSLCIEISILISKARLFHMPIKLQVRFFQFETF